MMMSITTHYIPKESSNLILCFSSAARRNPEEPYEFYKVCQETGYNILFIRETTSTDYTFYADLVDEIDHAFYSISEEYRKCVFTIGFSSGGFAALAYGCRYKARAIFATSPQLSVSEEFYDSLQPHQQPEACGTLRCTPNLKKPNAITSITKASLETCVGSVRIIYPHCNPHDEAQVSTIYGARNVTLIPVQSSSHVLDGHKDRILLEARKTFPMKDVDTHNHETTPPSHIGHIYNRDYLYMSHNNHVLSENHR
jgi:hypothetical protein